MTHKNVIEILAPAGSWESFRAAIHAGADAVYAGGTRFGARAYADNFSEEELKKAIDYAHLHGRKLYLTINTLLKEQETRQLYDYLEPLYVHGLDAVIVQDLGVLRLVKEQFPEMEIHASTQMSVVGAQGAAFLKECGVSRVVPARELSLDEIRTMVRKTGMEIECFVHGALCYCYSGQCLLSSLIGARSGNRGQCAQPCRLPYSVPSRSEKKYLLSPKDICTLDLLPELIDAGIFSFKIEGRMKRPEYVAAVTSVYRKYADLYLSRGRASYRVEESDRQALMDLYNRGGFSSGYYHKRNGREMLAFDRPNHAGVPAVKVLSQKGRELTAEALIDLHKGDLLEMNLAKEHYTFGKEISAGEKTVLLAPKGEHYRRGQILRRTRNQMLIEQLQMDFLEGDIQEKIQGTFYAVPGEVARLQVALKDIEICVCTEQPVQEAQNRPLEDSQIQKQLRKTGNTPFTFASLELKTNGNLFLPMQQLNDLRRRALEFLETEFCRSFRRSISPECSRENTIEKNTAVSRRETPPFLSVLVETPEQFKAVVCYPDIGRIYVDSNITSDPLRNPNILQFCDKAVQNGTQVFLAMPHIFRDDTAAYFASRYEEMLRIARDGVLVRSLESFTFLKERKYEKEILPDHNVYVFNRQAKAFWKDNGISSYTAPAELNETELRELGLKDMELIVYGRLPVMTSAQCIVKTTQGCTKRTEVLELTDRRKKRFPVKNQCNFCYNTVYNSTPLSLFEEYDSWSSMEPKSIRILLTTEDRKEAEHLIEAGLQACTGKVSVSPNREIGITKGHFKRGIL